MRASAASSDWRISVTKVARAACRPAGEHGVDRIGVTYVRLDEIVNGRRGVTPSTTLRLARRLAPLPASGSTGSSRSTCTADKANVPE